MSTADPAALGAAMLAAMREHVPSNDAKPVWRRIEAEASARGFPSTRAFRTWCLARDRAMVRAASRAHAEGRAVQVLALVAPWSPTHGTEYTAGEARRLGLEVTVKRFGEG